MQNKPHYTGDLAQDTDGRIRIERLSVGIAESNGKSEIDPDEIKKRLSGISAEVVDDPSLAHILALRSGNTIKTPEEFDQFPNLIGIVRAGNGTDNIDQEEATKRRILVMNTPEGSANGVAEMAVTYASALMKKTAESSVAFASGRWLRGDPEIAPQEWREVRVGVIGAGAIGKRFMHMVAASGATDIVYSDNRVDNDILIQAKKSGTVVAKKIELDKLLETCDVISIHTGGKSQILGHDKIAKIKNGSILLNTSRANNMDYDAASQRVIDGTLRLGADVMPQEKNPKRFENKTVQLLQKAVKTGRALITCHQSAESNIAKEEVLDASATRIEEALEIGVPNALPLNLRNQSGVGIKRRTEEGIRLVATYGDRAGAHNKITGALTNNGISFGGGVTFGDGRNDGHMATSIFDLPSETSAEAAIAIQKEITVAQQDFRVRLLFYTRAG